MDWSNERYVRVYVRETVGDVALTWQGRAIWREILIKCDRAGVIVLDGHGVRGLAGLIRMPPEVVEEHFQQLLDDGRVQIRGEYLIVPNYIEAQESTKSDAQRQRESREKRRMLTMAGTSPSQARSLVRIAILNGELSRGPCENCGSTSYVDAHHDDYSKPLQVR